MPASTKIHKLNVIVSGGGPVGLTLALLLQTFLENRVSVRVYDHRWKKGDHNNLIVWKDETEDTERNRRRQQVVTIQSSQYMSLPEELRGIICNDKYTSRMWPIARSEPNYPRNIRIAELEDRLLALANSKKREIKLFPSKFDAHQNQNVIRDCHVLAICEGASSSTREHFSDRFGSQGNELYSLDRLTPLTDIVLGLKIKTNLSSVTAVALTISQNRFLLNMHEGEGFLNMRLTDEEAEEVKGHASATGDEVECIQSNPCIMTRVGTGNEYKCNTHDAVFFPARDKDSLLMPRIREALKLFGVGEDGLEKITTWRLSMSQTCRFTAELYPESGAFGALLGDAANAIHFWPGRGLNSGLVSALSLARCLQERLATIQETEPIVLRNADFTRHEGIMGQLQFRHKTRAWTAMTAIDEAMGERPIKELIQKAVSSPDEDTEAIEERCKDVQSVIAKENFPQVREIGSLPGILEIIQIAKVIKASDSKDTQLKADVLKRLDKANQRLTLIEEKVYRMAMEKRVRDVVRGLSMNLGGNGATQRMPQTKEEIEGAEKEVGDRLLSVQAETLRTIYFSNPWNTQAMGGEEVALDLLFPDREQEARVRKEQEGLERQRRRHLKMSLAVLGIGIILGAVIHFHL